jgi:hypothetical protein
MIRTKILANLLKCAHPRHSQMAVLKDDPVTSNQGVLDKLCSFLSLTLTERHSIHLLLLRLSELLKEVKRVRTWREHEDQWGDTGRVLVNLRELEGRRRHELLAKVVHYEA